MAAEPPRSKPSTPVGNTVARSSAGSGMQKKSTRRSVSSSARFCSSAARQLVPPLVPHAARQPSVALATGRLAMAITATAASLVFEAP